MTKATSPLVRGLREMSLGRAEMNEVQRVLVPEDIFVHLSATESTGWTKVHFKDTSEIAKKGCVRTLFKLQHGEVQSQRW